MSVFIAHPAPFPRIPASPARRRPPVCQQTHEPARAPTRRASGVRKPAPTEQQTCARINACARRDDWYAARSAFLHYTSFSRPSSRLLACYVSALCRLRRVDDAQHALKRHPAADSPVARTAVIAAIARADDPDIARDMLRRCQTRLDMSAPHAHTAVMHAYALRGDANSARLVLQDAERGGVRVDVQMYDCMIRAFGRAGRMREAFKVLRVLREKQFAPTEHTFEGLIYACAHGAATLDTRASGLAARAYVVYDAAVSEGFRSVRVMNALLSAVLRGGWVSDERTGRFLEDLRSMKSELTEEKIRSVGLDPARFLRKVADLERLYCKHASDRHNRSSF